MNANEKQTLSLAAGQVLKIAAASGVTGSVVRLPRLPGGGNAQSVTPIAGANLTFGPYADTERFEIECTAGEVTITQAAPDPSLQATDAEVASLLATLQVTEKTPVNAVAAAGTLTCTSGGNQIAAGYKVVIDTKEYTFVTPMGAVEGSVLVGATDTASLLNLKDAINRDTPLSKDGVKYKVAAAHPTVEGTSSNATTVVVTALTKGVSTIATTKTGAEISWAHATLFGGVDGTVGAANEVCFDASYLYHCIAANTAADTNWRRIALGSVY